MGALPGVPVIVPSYSDCLARGSKGRAASDLGAVHIGKGSRSLGRALQLQMLPSSPARRSIDTASRRSCGKPLRWRSIGVPERRGEDREAHGEARSIVRPPRAG